MPCKIPKSVIFLRITIILLVLYNLFSVILLGSYFINLNMILILQVNYNLSETVNGFRIVQSE
jgi:hypothetical protein